MAKIIINENGMRHIINEEMSAKDVVNAVSKDKDFEKHIRDVIKDVLKNDKEADKSLEKKIKDVSANVVNKFLKTLWQRSNFFDAEIRN